MNFSIKLEFASESSFLDYTAELEEFLSWKKRRAEKLKLKQVQPEVTPTDRWAAVRDVHARARELQFREPLKTYRECLKECARKK
jgi:hypothetical protein